jgi:hypothetical protein
VTTWAPNRCGQGKARIIAEPDTFNRFHRNGTLVAKPSLVPFHLIAIKGTLTITVRRE